MTLRMTAVLVLAFITLACLGDVLRPAMAMAGDEDCFASCADHIGCGQSASPSASSTSAGHPMPLVATDGNPDLVPEATIARRPVWLSALSRDQQPVAPFAPRSPPLA
jgi:hypothetical protein